jgi:uroporphyrinogen-III synthase (EC 4.2.1.75)/uroporphyrinogen-III C-methyltransferase (EC 2.1.1.107)
MSVYLVGAGPGDEGLITVRGLELIKSADVIVYDNLADRGLLREARADARLIFAGKKAGCHSMRQAEINRLLVEEGEKAALAGQVVVRLKGGDPFLFGRGAEEMEALREAGLSFEIVPGVSSALAVPAYAGIPLTHRDFSSSVTIASGHSAPGNSPLDWGALAHGADTLVVLMGLANLEEITGNIIDSGVPLNTPAAVVEWGSTGRQRKVTGGIGTIAARVKRSK